MAAEGMTPDEARERVVNAVDRSILIPGCFRCDLSDDEVASTAHHIAWTIEGDWIRGELACTAPEGATCRLSCEKGCETWPCAETLDVEFECPISDAGACNAAVWINETGPQEAHGGDACETLRDGPVDVWWDGDSWRWAYRRGELM